MRLVVVTLVWLVATLVWLPSMTRAQRGGIVKTVEGVRAARRAFGTSANEILKFVEEKESMTVVEEGEDAALDPCAPQACSATFTSYSTRPLEIPCSVASGEMGEQPQLPLVYPGDYAFCSSLDFANAHFCTIGTGVLAIPLLDEDSRFEQEAFPLGWLHMGKCVSKRCSSRMLRKRFLGGAKEIAEKIAKKIDLKASSITTNRLARAGQLAFLTSFVQATIENTTWVRCEDEDREARGAISSSGGATLVIALFIALLTLCLTSTCYHSAFPVTKSKFILSFSLKRNVTALFAPMTSERDFLMLNGVRFISMAWVIYGHVVLMSSGLGPQFPVANPTAVDWQLQNIIMTLPRGAEYSVDTFFFMSGFLASHGVLASYSSTAGANASSSKPSKSDAPLPLLTLKGYLTMLFVRYMRLTPAYAVVLFFHIKLQPFLGGGPYYDANSGIGIREYECKDSWYYNLLYLNNLLPIGEKGGLFGCMPWSWYLANDFQFFCLVPPLALLFFRLRTKSSLAVPSPLLSRKLLRHAALYGPCLTLVVIQLASSWYTMSHYDIRGSFDANFNIHLYVKPWCRVSPYAVGMAFAFFLFDERETKRERDDELAARDAGTVGEEEDDEGSDSEESRTRRELLRLKAAAVARRRRAQQNGAASFIAAAGFDSEDEDEDEAGYGEVYSSGSNCIRCFSARLNRRIVKVVRRLAPHALFLAAMGLGGAIVFGLYDEFRCEAEPESDCRVWFGLFKYGVVASDLNWSKDAVRAYYVFTYLGWGLVLAALCRYFFSGHFTSVSSALSHQVFTPLARLTYNAYLVHIIFIQQFYTSAPTAQYVDPYKQVYESLAFVVAAYACSLALYLLIEKPCMNLIPWLLGLEREKKHVTAASLAATGAPGVVVSSALPPPVHLIPTAARGGHANFNNNSATNGGLTPGLPFSATIERDLSRVADPDNEVIAMGSPDRRRRVVGGGDVPRDSNDDAGLPLGVGEGSRRSSWRSDLIARVEDEDEGSGTLGGKRRPLLLT